MQRRHSIVLLCFCAVFVCYIDRVNISVAIIAMQDHFGWSDTVKGWVLSSFFVGYMIMQAPSGWLANRMGGKIILGIAVLWWSVFTIITPLAAGISLTVLLIARIGMGLGEAAMFPAAYSMFGKWVPTNERGRSVGFLLSGIPLGTLFALTTTGWLVTRYGWESVFYIFGIVGVFWCIAWFWQAASTPGEDPRITPEEKDKLAALDEATTITGEVPWRMLLSHSAVRAVLINHFCSNWGLYVLLAWLPSYFRDAQGLSITSAGIYSAAPWMTMFVVSNLASTFADRMIDKGVSVLVMRKTMQCLGLLGAAAFLLAAQSASSPMVALLLMCGALAGIALTWAGYAPNLLDIAPRYADILMGVSNTTATIPGIIGVAIAGWLVQTTGTYAAVFVLAASIQIFGAIIWFLFARAEPIVD